MVTRNHGRLKIRSLPSEDSISNEHPKEPVKGGGREGKEKGEKVDGGKSRVLRFQSTGGAVESCSARKGTENYKGKGTVHGSKARSHSTTCSLPAPQRAPVPASKNVEKKKNSPRRQRVHHSGKKAQRSALLGALPGKGGQVIMTAKGLGSAKTMNYVRRSRFDGREGASTQSKETRLRTPTTSSGAPG